MVEIIHHKQFHLTLCDALKKRDQPTFEKDFYSLVDKAKYLSSKANKRFKIPLTIIDVSLFSKGSITNLFEHMIRLISIPQNGILCTGSNVNRTALV
jgi:hypothetical protein